MVVTRTNETGGIADIIETRFQEEEVRHLIRSIAILEQMNFNNVFQEVMRCKDVFMIEYDDLQTLLGCCRVYRNGMFQWKCIWRCTVFCVQKNFQEEEKERERREKRSEGKERKKFEDWNNGEEEEIFLKLNKRHPNPSTVSTVVEDVNEEEGVVSVSDRSVEDEESDYSDGSPHSTSSLTKETSEGTDRTEESEGKGIGIGIERRRSRSRRGRRRRSGKSSSS
ncbi:hypothetical protein ADUPG1_011676, partial [Aduncisulcus paluster]